MSDGGRDSEALDSRRIQAAVTRRDVLLGGATATLAGLAGCSGQSGEQSTTTTSTTTTTTESGGTEGTTTSTQAERVDQTLVSHMWSVPTEVQFNPWNPQQQSGHLNNHLFLSLAKYNGVAREWGKEIAEDWTYSPDEQTFEVTISGDYKWHDGSPVTTKDVAVGNRIDEYFGATMWNYVDSIDVPDDTTIRYNLSGSVNKNLLFNSILPGEIRTRESEYGEWLQKFRDAEGDDSKVDEVRTNLTSYSQDEAVGNNVWKVEQLSKQAARLGIWDEQPGAGKINYPTLRLLFQNSNKKNWLALKTGDQTIAQVAMPANIRETMPESVVRYTWRAWFGLGLGYQFDDPVFGNRKVRQAIAYVVDNDRVAKNAGATGRTGVEIPAGIPGPGRAPDFLGDRASSFQTYERDTEKAASLLKDEGFTKDGDTWYRPNGNPFEAPIMVASGQNDSLKGIQTVVDSLSKFGIQAKTLAKGGTSLYGSIIPNGEFRIVATFWARSRPFPYYNYTFVWDDQQNNNKSYHWPTKAEGVPKPFDPEGETTTIDTRSLVTDLGKAPTKEEQLRLTRKLAWAYNQQLAVSPLYHQDGGHFVNGEGWNLPPNDLEGPASPQYDIQYWQVDHGFVEAKGE